MPVSHSSSASLSSLSLSRTSHTSASSLSSPPSSPDSATNTSLTTQNPSASPHRTSSAVLQVSPSIIPFSWEETPGVLKKEIMQTSRSAERHGGDPRFFHRDVDELYARAYAATEENLQPLNSCKHTRRCVTQGPRTACTGEGLPRIRLPPCLLHPEQHASMVEGHERTTLQRPHSNHHHHHHHPAAAVGSKIMSSLFLHKRRHHRSTPSLEDDPFWLAMVACTNDADKGVPVHRKGPKAFLPHEISRTDSRLARRVQESIHLDQCIPHQGSMQSCTISRNFRSRGGQAKAFDQARYDVEEAFNSVKFSPSKVHNTRTDIGMCHLDVEENESIHSDGLAGKAFKALSLARTELHGRCKALRQQQGPPIVDISCTSRRAKCKGSGIAAKHKRPDVFGSKSNRPLIVSSRFSEDLK